MITRKKYFIKLYILCIPDLFIFVLINFVSPYLFHIQLLFVKCLLLVIKLLSIKELILVYVKILKHILRIKWKSYLLPIVATKILSMYFNLLTFVITNFIV